MLFNEFLFFFFSFFISYLFNKAENKNLQTQNLNLKNIVHQIFNKIKEYEFEEMRREKEADVKIEIY